MTPFQPQFRLDLPHGRCVGVALPGRAHGDADADADADADGEIPDAVLAALPAEEQQRVQVLPPGRRASWVGGRIALRAALADLALGAGAILSTARGAPLLPAGARGSISHKDGVAVALAAVAGEWHLGVDVERVVADRPDISGRVLRPEEIAHLPPPGDPRRAEEILFAFSAKEAIYKALDPFVARYVSFGEVAVARRADGTAGVGFFLRAEDGRFEAEVGWLRRDDLILTTARVTRVA